MGICAYLLFKRNIIISVEYSLLYAILRSNDCPVSRSFNSFFIFKYQTANSVFGQHVRRGGDRRGAIYRVPFINRNAFVLNMVVIMDAINRLPTDIIISSISTTP